MDILQAIGNTSLVRLAKVVKLEWENPTGSMKDRMAQAVIARAEADGRLQRTTKKLILDMIAAAGTFAGTSSGANVVAAVQIAERLGPAATVVTLMADS